MKHVFMIVFMGLFVFYASISLAAEPIVIDGDVPAEGGFRPVILAQDIEHPWSMAWLPNGDVLITERPGRLRLIRDGRLLTDPVDGIPEVYASGQGGLLDLSLDPRFEENGRVSFTYAHGSVTSNRTRVASATLEKMTLKNWRVIFEVSTAKVGNQHFGSRMAWLPDGSLLVTIGDGGNPTGAAGW